MDPLIENLKSTTFFGKRLTRRQIADIQETCGSGAWYRFDHAQRRPALRP